MTMISIIVPVFNAEKWINRCVDSLIAQTYTDIEIIIVNDGSTDRSDLICKSYFEKDSRIKYYYKQNGGVSSARNAGLQIANGEFIMFVDSDDCIDSKTCEIMIGEFKNEIDMVVCGLNVFCGDTLLRSPNIGTQRIVLSESIDHYWELRKINLGPCNKMYKRSLISIDFDTNLSFGEDTKFVIDYMRNCRVVQTVSNCLYNVHVDNPTSLNQSYKGDKLSQLIKVREEELKYLKAVYEAKCDSRIYERFFLDLHVVLYAIIQSRKAVCKEVNTSINSYNYSSIYRNTKFGNKYYRFFAFLVASKKPVSIIILIKIRMLISSIIKHNIIQ